MSSAGRHRVSVAVIKTVHTAALIGLAGLFQARSALRARRAL
jgi:hypothetical protein